MSKILLILLICLLNPSFILMLNNGYVSLESNEYFIDTCCSLNENQRIYLSCSPNEKIRLNLIEIHYNSDEYCSSELYCCKARTKCSRRITKYSNLHCDESNSCWIDKTCLKIYHPCASIYGLYGQYITIDYSCLPNNTTDYQPVPFILKLLTSDRTTTTRKSLIKKNDFKSSPLSLIALIFIFLLFMFIIYWLANQIGKKICRQNGFKKSGKMGTKMYVEHFSDDKTKVESNPSLPITRIYPSQTIYRYNNQPSYYDYHNSSKYPYTPHSFNSYQRYINIEHDPTTGQIYSRTFNPYFNYYSN